MYFMGNSLKTYEFYRALSDFNNRAIYFLADSIFDFHVRLLQLSQRKRNKCVKIVEIQLMAEDIVRD